jgi:hypothetical protein
MWQRKTSSEIRRVDWWIRFDPTFAFCFALLVAIIITLAQSSGYRWRPTEPISVSIRMLPLYFLIMFVLTYLAQTLPRIPEAIRRQAMICDRCKEIVGFTTQLQCTCGGARELLSHWKWVPDDMRDKTV